MSPEMRLHQSQDAPEPPSDSGRFRLGRFSTRVCRRVQLSAKGAVKDDLGQGALENRELMVVQFRDE